MTPLVLTRTYTFGQFLHTWMSENTNYNDDWCWTKNSIYRNGEDITEDLLQLMMNKMGMESK